MATDKNTAITSEQIRKHTLQLDDINPASLVWQEPVISKNLTAPPSSGNAEGDRYLIINGDFSWDLLDEDCADISDWADQDAENGESTQVTFDGKSCFKFDTNVASGGNYARRVRSSALPNNYTIELNLYCDAIGTSQNFFRLQVGSGIMTLEVDFRSDGLFINDGTQAQEVGTNLVVQDVWQKWRFEVTGGNAETATVDVYLNDVLQVSGFDCSVGSSTANVFLLLAGLTDNDRIAYVDYLKIGTGLANQNWYGQDNNIAQYINSSWSYYTPLEGWFTWVKDEDKLYRFDGSSWAEFSSGGISNIVEDTTPQLGGNLDMNGYSIGGNTEANIDNAVAHKDLTNNPHSVDIDDLGLASGIVAADIDDAITKKHTQNTDTALGAQSEALDMNTHKIVGVVDPTTDQEAATKKYVDDNGGGDTLPIVDTTGIAKGSGDATKIVRLEVDGITTETTRVLTVQDKDYTIADKAEVDKTKKTTLGLTVDGGGIELTTGIKGYIAIPYNCTITGWVALADISGSIKIDVWKDVYANYPPDDTDSITNGHEPEITTATKAEDSDLGDWSSVTVTAGDVIGFSVDSITDITRLTLILQVTKT